MKYSIILLFWILAVSNIYAESFTWKPSSEKEMKKIDIQQYGDDPLTKALRESEIERKKEIEREKIRERKRERKREEERLLAGEFVKIPAGSFRMGDVFGKGEPSEKPVHEVRIQSFYLGKYEVTQSQWQKVMGGNPSRFSGCSNCPVENVSWNNIQEYISKLNKITGPMCQGSCRL